MKELEIAEFAKANVEPLQDDIYGPRYRAAAHLADGTYLPCVVFQSKRKQLALALRRFDETKKQQRGQYEMVVETFAAGGSRVNYYDISKVEASRFAWPLSTLKQIHGETVMSWTAFVVEMTDGRRFSYGSSFRFEFFDLPEGYGHQDIRAIHSGMVHLDAEGTLPFTMDQHKKVNYLREKPFFTCYIDGLDY